jgi:dihydropyrimidinase
MFDLVIAGGQIITPNGLVHADVAVDGESIAAIGSGLEGRTVLRADGCYVIPGGVDQHVHMQLPLAGRVSTDTFATGSVAAACGGTTTFIDFVTPNPAEPLLDALAARRAEADGQVAVDYGLHMTIPTWHGAASDRLADISAALAAGCSTFKMYQAYDGMMLDDQALYRAMCCVAEAGGSVVLHSETGPLLDLLRAEALAQGRTSPIEHERTRPARLEATAIARAAEVAHLAHCPLLIFHVGNGAAVAAIAAARARGVEIWGETCPQYLLLTADEHLGGPDGARYVCAPPLRSQADQDAVWRALADDDLQLVSTDHCPWTLAEKAQPDFTQIPGGVPSIEARLALLHHAGVRAGRITLQRWVEICAINPARRMGLARKGQLAPGYDADIVLFDPARTHTLSRRPGQETLHEAADWTPYEGMTVHGWPRTVLLRGRVIVRDEQWVGAVGDGQFVARL